MNMMNKMIVIVIVMNMTAGQWHGQLALVSPLLHFILIIILIIILTIIIIIILTITVIIILTIIAIIILIVMVLEDLYSWFLAFHLRPGLFEG